MRSYLVDEISDLDINRIEEFLKNHAVQSPLDKLYWIPLPDDLLNEAQTRHTACRPHVFPVELGPGSVKMEFFIRSLNKLSCSCQSYCSPRQRDYILRFMDRMMEDLQIKT